MAPTFQREEELWAGGYRWVAGLDEVGRGPWAGPVVAAAVIFPPHLDPPLLKGVTDSKQLTPPARERLSRTIQDHALAWGVGLASPKRIDRAGIVAATRLAMGRAVRRLRLAPDALLVDFLTLPQLYLPQEAIRGGDASSLTIAAASILAKVYRDRLMAKKDTQYPGYGFARNKGYGTPEHRRALGALGPCSMHRRSVAPVRASLERMPSAPGWDAA